MARPSEPATILVLRKTRLGETDLIITGLSDEGAQVRAVAKGARKPGSRLSASLELYSITRILLHRGKNLDLITEAHIEVANRPVRADVLHSAGAAVIVEFLEKATRDGMEEPRLFALSAEAIRCVGAVPDEGIALICAAALWKLSAQLGFAPQLSECVSCGQTVSVSADSSSAVAPLFSLTQGGVVCEDCQTMEASAGGTSAGEGIALWIAALIGSRFADLEEHAASEEAQAGPELLRLASEWLSVHLAIRLKSLDFLLRL